MKQPNYGRIIRAYRKKRNRTQEETAEDLCCSPITVSRVETGAQMPSWEMLSRAIELMGESTQEYIPLLLGGRKKQAYNAMNELHRLRAEENDEALRDKIKALEGKPPFNKGLYLQYLLLCKAEAEEGLTDEQRLEMLMEAIRMTKKDFCAENIALRPFAQNEIAIVGRIADLHFQLGDKEKAVQIMYGLREAMNNFYQDGKEKARTYPTVVYNLAQYLSRLDRDKEAFALCEEAKECAITYNSMRTLPSILAMMSGYYFLIQDDYNARDYLLQAYYTARAMKRFRLAKIIMRIAKNEWNLELDRIVIPTLEQSAQSESPVHSAAQQSES